MKEFELKYGCNPNQKPSKVYMADGSALPFEVNCRSAVLMDAKTDDPKGFGLGYSIYYYFNNMDLFYDTKSQLKLLEIDGIYPNDETIADGTYPLSNNTYIVLRKDTPPDSPARKMAEFMLTDEGQTCVELAGYGKLKK